MDALELKKVLLEAVANDWDDGRQYLGMSMIGQCPRKLYYDLVEGRRQPGVQGVLYCHEGYVHERDVRARLEQMGVEVEEVGKELVAFGGRVQGHIDGMVGGVLLEVKSVDAHGLENVRDMGAKARHFDQVQAYMHWGGYERALVVYKERESGELWVCEVVRNAEVGQKLEGKAREILAAVDAGEPPECECGHCRR